MVDYNKLAEKAVKTIKAELVKQKKNNTNYVDPWYRQPRVDISWDCTFDGTDYSISIGRDNVLAKGMTASQCSGFFSSIYKGLMALKGTKGWGGLNFPTESVYLNGNFWDGGIKGNVITKITLSDAPCKEYKSLMNYINKYGKGEYGTCPNLKNYELFSAQMGGKRGRLWDEYGDRYFLDNKPKRCARILEELRKARGTNDRMICKRGNEDYIDPIDQKYSAYHEIECEGERRYFLEIIIKTPSGKVKYTEKIY